MLTIISPAKSMDFESPSIITQQEYTQPDLMEQSLKLLPQLQKLKPQQITSLMKVSDKIAQVNYERFQNFATLPTKEAINAYDGDLYANMGRETFSHDNFIFAQQHMRIISGLYGLLRPLDGIKPYRLEMVIKLPKIAPKGLNSFWQDLITQKLHTELQQHKTQYLINLASNEYSSTVNPKSLSYPVVNINFLENRDGTLKNIALNSKRARGLLANYIITNSIDDPKAMQSFSASGYKFDALHSDEHSFTFIRRNDVPHHLKT
jgi:cytoplasmic iron level regulating protein YaaA (DUF328/UPF0246 family)